MIQFSPTVGMISNEDFIEKLSPENFPIVRGYRKLCYYNIPAAFDIEVSSFYQDGEKKACMYVWQFGIMNWVTYGRTWEEFISLLEVVSTKLELSPCKRLIVYIHNFSYEFQFMRKHFEWDKLFFLEERKPVYGITGGIEFRCSLKLSSKSLKNVGKDLQKYHVEKKVGDLDYNLIRTSKTELTKLELGYCENDIRVLLAYIQEKIETDGKITKIPLTNTGYVRNYCREQCFKNFTRYHWLMQSLTLDVDEYFELKQAFAGGFTHASAKYVGKICKDVGSFDFTSSYPAVMLLEKFPMSKSTLVDKIENLSQLNYYLDNYCCLIDITINDLIPTVDYDHPISVSKTIESEDVIKDNGRIVTASMIRILCTEVDLRMYVKFYRFGKITVNKLRIYEKAYLPKNFIKAILELYKMKTVLKGVDGEEINYMISKNMLNSAYGMTVTDIMRDIISYCDDLFSSTEPNPKEVIAKYNTSIKRFLFYPWGIWVTSYARYNLFTGILACGKDYIYSDTDSIKIFNPESHMDYINSYNENVNKKIEAVCEFFRLDASEFSPLNKKKVPKPIGVWDYEGKYDEFKTLGAKRYMYRKGDEYSLTVAGLHKELGRDYLVKNFKNPFEGFNIGLTVPANYSGRTTATYIDEECSGTVRDYLGKVSEFSELSYIHMEQSEYNMDMSDDYKTFLDTLMGRKDISW